MAISEASDELKIETRGKSFSEEYRFQVFLKWYNMGKPTADSLVKHLEDEGFKDPFLNAVPGRSTIHSWINNEFALKAARLDEEASKGIEQQLIAGKIAMLIEHSEIGHELYEMGIAYLRENGLGSARNALSAVISGLQIEREAVTPIKFSKLDKLSDQELLQELNKLVEGAKIEILPTEDD